MIPDCFLFGFYVYHFAKKLFRVNQLLNQKSCYILYSFIYAHLKLWTVSPLFLSLLSFLDNMFVCFQFLPNLAINAWYFFILFYKERHSTKYLFIFLSLNLTWAIGFWVSSTFFVWFRFTFIYHSVLGSLCYLWFAIAVLKYLFFWFKKDCQLYTDPVVPIIKSTASLATLVTI